MTAYNVTTNFGSKDDLTSGNAAKKIKGSEFTTEFNNIATGVNSKADTTTVNTTTATANAALPKAGGAMTGAITTNSTFDGRDVATDGTKLDAIEASADVTDVTNVTAAGALMDSEVTNLAQVKAFASADYATAAQGTLATNALPKAGGTLTGALNVDVVANPTITLKNTDTTIVADQVIGTVEFRGADDDGNVLAGHIQQVSASTWGIGDYNSDMVFSTKTGGTGGPFTEKLRLGATGITIPNKIMHSGDTDTHIEFVTDRINFIAGNATMMSLVEEATGYDYVKMGTGSNTVTVNLADGSLTATGNITAYSDITLKENIEVIDNALDKVCAIRGVTYNRKDKDISDRQAGVIAQEIEKVLPEVVITDENGIKAVAYGNVVGLLVEAIKELKDEIEELKRSK